MKASRGVYLLLIEILEESQIVIGKLGTQVFPKGFYLYIGSALGGTSTSLGWRITRYLTISKRKHRWHIDYLLDDKHTEITEIFFAKTHEDMECTLSKAVLTREWIETPIKGFGASDCPANCPAHLYRSKIHDNDVLAQKISLLFKEINMTPEKLKRGPSEK